MHKKKCLLVAILILFSSTALAVVPDFYAEPGKNPNREHVPGSLAESIDPFSGTLHLTHSEMYLPGNGGLGINIVRYYTNMEDDALFSSGKSIFGEGWNIHMGMVRTQSDFNPCISPSGVQNNAVWVAPGGTTQLFAYSNGFIPSSSGDWVTKERWRMECSVTNDGKANDLITVYSPDGMKYELRENHLFDWFVTKIIDPNNNSISITYKTVGNLYKKKVIDRVTSSSAGTVGFFYLNESSDKARLDRITSSPGLSPDPNTVSRVVKYSYITEKNNFVDYNFLVKADYDGAGDWKYDYNLIADAPVNGLYSLKEIIKPHGGKHTYTYQRVAFDPAKAFQLTTAISQKQIYWKDTTNPYNHTIDGTWSYAFTPVIKCSFSGGSSAKECDRTIVTTPDGIHEYRHYGYSGSPVGTLWRVGLLREKVMKDLTNNVLNVEVYDWSNQKISNQNYFRPSRNKKDFEYLAPVLAKKTVTRDGTPYITEYLSYDKYGNVQSMRETGNTGQKITDYTYYKNTSKWIVKRIQDEKTRSVKRSSSDAGFLAEIKRTYSHSEGNLLAENRYGVNSNYEYDLDGNVSKMTDARGKSTLYLDYYRGVSRDERQPEGITIKRTVSGTGNVLTEQNGRGFTYKYSYDGQNRVVSIDRPGGSADIGVAWSTGGCGLGSCSLKLRKLTRANYVGDSYFDGFGNDNRISAGGVTIFSKSDPFGRKIFESNPNSTLGMSYEYDTLGRPTRITHPKVADETTAKFQKYEYLSGNRVRVTNERGFQTVMTYRSYGDPDQKSIIRIETAVGRPESVVTNIERNKLDHILSVAQGGFTRSYAYNNNFFRISETHPETGVTNFTYDAVGNMKTRTVPDTDLQVIYTYDDVNRVVAVDYPQKQNLNNCLFCKDKVLISNTSSPEIDTGSDFYIYDKNSNVTSSGRGEVVRNYIYDAVDNMTEESLGLDGLNFKLNYAYNNLDYLVSTTYPSGQSVAYTPDILGRPTTATGYVNNVVYHPNGVPATVTYANAQVGSYTLDERLRAKNITANGVNNALNLDYVYDGSNNITSITDNLLALNNRAMSYDANNRLTSAAGRWGSGSIGYNTTGDITAKNVGDRTIDYTYDAATNRLSTVEGNLYGRGEETLNLSYDNFGNISNKQNVVYRGNIINAYDFANTLRTERTVPVLVPKVYPPPDYTTAVHTYDCKNLRVKSDRKGKLSYYLYASNGKLMVDYNVSKAQLKEYVFLDSMLVASRAITGSSGDTDGDGLPDAFEAANRLNPFSATDASLDNDGDGLTNLAEYQAGTDIMNPDTDGDGLSDGDEVNIHGTSPVLADTDGDGTPDNIEIASGTNPTVNEAMVIMIINDMLLN